MAVARTKEEMFQEIISLSKGEDTTDDLIALGDKIGFWDDDPGLRKAERAYKARNIRDFTRMNGWTDADGNPTEIRNVIRKDQKSDQKTQLYVQTSFMKLDDYIYTMEYWKDKEGYARLQQRKTYTEALARLPLTQKRKFQQLFQFEGED